MNVRVVLFLVVFCANAAYGLHVKVDAHENRCFYENVKHSTQKIIFSFQVIDGGFLDIDVSVHKPTGAILWEGTRLSHIVRTFHDPGPGMYSFCFNNTMSTLTTKVVKFDFAVVDDELPANASKLEIMVLKLREDLKQVKTEQSYLTERMELHLKLKNSTNTNVILFALFHDILMLLVCALQVYFLMRFFSVTRIV